MPVKFPVSSWRKQNAFSDPTPPACPPQQIGHFLVRQPAKHYFEAGWFGLTENLDLFRIYIIRLTVSIFSNFLRKEPLV